MPKKYLKTPWTNLKQEQKYNHVKMNVKSVSLSGKKFQLVRFCGLSCLNKRRNKKKSQAFVEI